MTTPGYFLFILGQFREGGNCPLPPLRSMDQKSKKSFVIKLYHLAIKDFPDLFLYKINMRFHYSQLLIFLIIECIILPIATVKLNLPLFEFNL